MPVRQSFELVSPFKAAGDQVEAIDALVKGIQQGDKAQTLLGVTGSGKTFTMANVIAKLNRPTMILVRPPVRCSGCLMKISVLICIRLIS